MENTANIKFKFTALTAINIAKATTIILLIGFALILEIHDWRQVIYLCLHISYCLWWLMEQWFYPQRISQKEKTMSEKYSDYADYQNSTPRLIPFIW